MSIKHDILENLDVVLHSIGQTSDNRYLIEYSSLTSTFTEGETLTNDDSATATLLADDTRINMAVDMTSGTFSVGDTLTGGTSSATCEVVTVTQSNYNTTVREVVAGTIRRPEDYSPGERRALIQTRWDAQSSSRGAAGAADQYLTRAEAVYPVRASMTNVTHESFTNLLEDIEASVTKDETRGRLAGNYYDVRLTYISEQNIVDTKDFDEKRVSTGHYRELVAEMLLTVVFRYMAKELSG